MYYTVKELVGISGMPANERNVRIALNKLASDDQKRKRESVNSKKPIEYHIDCLPDETRMALIQQQAQTESEQARSQDTRPFGSEELWFEYDMATEEQKARAVKAHELCVRVRTYVESGMTMRKALRQVADESGVTYGRIHRYFYISPGLVKNKIPKNDWLASLLDHRGGVRAMAHIPEEAWQLFLADYLRAESPTLKECYRRVSNLATERGWKLPCADTFSNRIKSHVPYELIVLKRGGLFAAQQTLVPAQRRTRVGLHALQRVSGDGHKCRVFCELDDGTKLRPTIWAFVDAYSSMIVGYSVDVSENTEMLGIAIHRMVSKYGIPEIFDLDNGSAALSEAMTGRMSRPGKDGSGKLIHRKFDRAEVTGVITGLGSDVNWTRVIDDNNGRKGNARAKPVERLFHSKGGFGQFERHPAFEGAYTGADTSNKPANYGSKTVPMTLFLELLDQWIYQWNHEKGRRTEMAKGVHSYVEVFERSYKQSAIAKPTAPQLAMCLLSTRRALKVRDDATVELNAGRYSSRHTNRYHSPELFQYVGQKINLRFNPYDVSEYVLAYTENDKFICQLPIYGDVHYTDLSAARRHNLNQSSAVDRAQWLGSELITKDINEVAEALAPKEHEKTDVGGAVPSITKMVPELPRDIDGFEYVEKKKRAVGHDTPEVDYSEFNSEEVTASLIRNFGK